MMKLNSVLYLLTLLAALPSCTAESSSEPGSELEEGTASDGPDDGDSDAAPRNDSADALSAGVVYYNNFDGLTPGLYTDKRRFKRDMGVTWANGFLKPGSSEETTNRITATSSPSLGGRGLSVEILYPKGQVDSKASGAQWQNEFARKDLRDLYLSYWVRPQSGTDFTKGGKLPGLGGVLSGSSSEREWSGKLMWRGNGALQFYMHVPATAEKDYPWDHTGEQARLTRGEWQHIEIHYRLNTPGRRDGLLEGWLNGRLVGRVSDFMFSGARDGLTGIHYFFFSTFYGGNETYAPSRDQIAHFDEVTVSTRRVGYDASLASR